MLGCLGRLGCLVLLAVLAFCGWITKDWWYPKVRGLVVSTPPAATVMWQPMTEAAARAGERAAARLGERSGPVYASMTPAEFAAWQVMRAVRAVDAPGAAPEAAVHGDTLLVRATIAVAELGDPKQLGPLAQMLDGKQPVRIGGVLSAERPGAIRLRVTHVSVNELKVPMALIAKIVQHVSAGARSDSLTAGVIVLPAPKQVADVRVANGKIVLYKAVP